MLAKIAGIIKRSIDMNFFISHSAKKKNGIPGTTQKKTLWLLF